MTPRFGSRFAGVRRGVDGRPAPAPAQHRVASQASCEDALPFTVWNRPTRGGELHLPTCNACLPAPAPCLCSPPSHARPSSQELTFEVGPSPEESPKLQAALYAVTPDDTDTDSFLCGGRWASRCIA